MPKPQSTHDDPLRRDRGMWQVRLPDFRNLGVMSRIVVIAELSRMSMAVLCGGSLDIALDQVVALSPIFEPALLCILLSLFLMAPSLQRMSYRMSLVATLLVTLVTALAWWAIVRLMFVEVIETGWVRVALTTLLIAVLGLAYFDWRFRVLSPALPNARLMALQARIRPHFLFNSLNTVLGLMREDARKAEHVLLNLSDLYRALLADSDHLVSLGRELELARSYGEIESIRLEGRIKFSWNIGNAPMDALVPPLLLQPLIENAVYHGVEPLTSGGEVSVTMFLKGDQLHLVVRNPCQATGSNAGGNGIALSNIRERLALHFDAEAALVAFAAGDEFVVQVRMPYRHG